MYVCFKHGTMLATIEAQHHIFWRMSRQVLHFHNNNKSRVVRCTFHEPAPPLQSAKSRTSKEDEKNDGLSCVRCEVSPTSCMIAFPLHSITLPSRDRDEQSEAIQLWFWPLLEAQLSRKLHFQKKLSFKVSSARSVALYLFESFYESYCPAVGRSQRTRRYWKVKWDLYLCFSGYWWDSMLARFHRSLCPRQVHQSWLWWENWIQQEIW